MKNKRRFLISILVCCMLGLIYFLIPKTFSDNATINNITVSYDSTVISLTGEQALNVEEVLRNIEYLNQIGITNRISLEDNPLLISCSVDNKPMHFVLGELNIMYSNNNLFFQKILNADYVYESFLSIIEAKP